jgi:Asp-tRNA(Asn)/Glu-tRNA(Gln) amidotransferase A subunit family amidase
MTDRRTFLMLCATAGFPAAVADGLWNKVDATGTTGLIPGETTPTRRSPITRSMVKAAEALAGLEFTDGERDLMLERLESNLAAYEAIRLIEVPNHVPPAVQFSVTLPGRSYPGSTRRAGARTHSQPAIRLPAAKRDLAFLSVMELAELIRTRQLSATELTNLYLERLVRHDSRLHCVVTLTEERARRKAAEADRQIAAGHYRGPLHGIPYGVKDTMSVPGYPTTWGAAIYRNRVMDSTATVVQRLDAAGAILVAKLAMGELGLSDTWYGGRTMNPWKPAQGAMGSSAGSAVAVAAGLVGFALGTETMGSIVAPATRNGVTGLRPTFGRVSRHGAMVLSWSLDKIGPMARSVEDCAVVLEAIAGPDGRDSTVLPVPYAWDPDRPLSAVRVGYFKAAFDAPSRSKARDAIALQALRKLGVQLVEVDLPTDIPIISLLLIRVEAAAALEDVARSGGLPQLVEQGADGWPNFIRAGGFVPAVEYLQANRVRTLLMQRLDGVFQDLDVFMAPSFAVMAVANLTGHPAVVMPNGLLEDGIPSSVSFVGRLFGESKLCTVARIWQEATGWHRLHPEGFS